MLLVQQSQSNIKKALITYSGSDRNVAFIYNMSFLCNLRNRAFVYSLGIGSLHGNSIENFVIKLLYWHLLTTICSAHVLIE